ncbi:ABC transporter ATP-binding protein [Paenibacillus chitinolyticus]|uniref:ABC transporter ATP-binding protein n=1 Tax=Paenibacillus chitinolyticus TaxID=79263 RepID=UPI002DC03737|nr:ABC transporter ATP-binding protein [Paenibacillus chitinolyticus]MEC0248515.1 ABC transporter ATP-binding protein [Paenibacillus chitinolyticus]
MTNEHKTGGRAGAGAVRRLLAYAWAEKRAYSLALLLLALATAIQLSGPYILKIVVDDHIQYVFQRPWLERTGSCPPGESRTAELKGSCYVQLKDGQTGGEGRTVRFLQDGEGYVLDRGEQGRERLSADDVKALYKGEMKPVAGWVSLYAVLIVLGLAGKYAHSRLFYSISFRIARTIRMDVMRHLHRLPLKVYDRTMTGELVTKLAQDTEGIKTLFIQFCSVFVMNGAMLVGIFIAMFLLNVKLALASLLLLAVFALIMGVHLKLVKPLFEQIRTRFGEMNALLLETVAALPVVQMFGREEAVADQFRSKNKDWLNANMRQMRIEKLSSWNISGLIQSVFLLAIVWFLGRKVGTGAVSLGMLYIFVEYSVDLIKPVVNMLSGLSGAQLATVSADRVFSLMDEEPMAREKGGAINKPRGHISFENVTFAYDTGRPAVSGISFEIPAGRTVALVGATGAGKSTLANLLLGFQEPQEGRITLDGVDLRDIPGEALRNHMGVVLQEPFLFGGDIRSNVAPESTQADDDAVEQALREVGAMDFVDKLPARLDTEMMWRGGNFSGGQKQLIAFARAWARQPAILVLDEPTASMDAETEKELRQAWTSVTRGRTTLMIAHKLSAVRDADLIVMLHDGRIVEKGTHQELMGLKGPYYHMVRLQTREA